MYSKKKSSGNKSKSPISHAHNTRNKHNTRYKNKRIPETYKRITKPAAPKKKAVQEEEASKPSPLECSIPNCENGSPDSQTSVSYYDFPRDSKMQQKWKRQIDSGLKLNQRFNIKSAVKICSRHFLDGDFQGDDLKPDAFPTIFEYQPEEQSASDRGEQSSEETPMDIDDASKSLPSPDKVEESSQSAAKARKQFTDNSVKTVPTVTEPIAIETVATAVKPPVPATPSVCQVQISRNSGVQKGKNVIYVKRMNDQTGKPILVPIKTAIVDPSLKPTTSAPIILQKPNLVTKVAAPRLQPSYTTVATSQPNQYKIVVVPPQAPKSVNPTLSIVKNQAQLGPIRQLGNGTVGRSITISKVISLPKTPRPEGATAKAVAAVPAAVKTAQRKKVTFRKEDAEEDWSTDTASEGSQEDQSLFEDVRKKHVKFYVNAVKKAYNSAQTGNSSAVFLLELLYNFYHKR